MIGYAVHTMAKCKKLCMYANVSLYGATIECLGKHSPLPPPLKYFLLHTAYSR